MNPAEFRSEMENQQGSSALLRLFVTIQPATAHLLRS